jgi:hypothetical protein
MPAQKRPLDESSSTKNAKKFRTNDTAKSLLTEEVDFPRGGGTTFTPLEVKAIRAEAVKEANAELFEVSHLFILKEKWSLNNSCSGYSTRCSEEQKEKTQN